MATLNIDFSYDDNVKRSINNAKSSLNTRINDYTRIKRNLNDMSSTGNLTTANTYIQKKISSLERKKERLDSFYTAVNTFNTNAGAADRRVATRINTETKAFYKREGIKTGILYTIGSVLGKGAEWLKGKFEELFSDIWEACKTLWANIKQWYEDNKWWLDVLIDAVIVVAAVVSLVATIATGGAGFAFFAAITAGVWSLAKAGADLIYDGIAMNAYMEGDMETYEEVSEKGLKDAMGEHIPGGEYLYYGMEIATAIYGIYKVGKNVSDIFKDYKTLYNGDGKRAAFFALSDETKRDIIKSDIKNTLYDIAGITNMDSATGGMNWKNAISATEWTVTTFRDAVSAKDGKTYFLDSNKITSLPKKVYTNANALIGRISTDISFKTMPGVMLPAMAV